MKEREQACELLEKIKNKHPTRCFNDFDAIEKGIGFVLMYLHEHSGQTYAKNIADSVGVSRARMAVLLNKMIQQGFIEKRNLTQDKRIDLLSITPLGIEYISVLKNKAIDKMMFFIKKIGYDEMNNFIDTAIKIAEFDEEQNIKGDNDV